MREATTFSRILEMKMRFEIGRKLLRSSVDRDGFLRRGWTRACLNDDGKDSFRKREIDKICDDWTEFIEAEFQKESWDGIQGTLFTFRSRHEFVNFKESGWNKIGHLWEAGQVEKETDQGNEMVKNLVRMRSILSLKKSMNVLAREDVSGDSGSEFEGFR